MATIIFNPNPSKTKAGLYKCVRCGKQDWPTFEEARQCALDNYEREGRSPEPMEV